MNELDVILDDQLYGPLVDEVRKGLPEFAAAFKLIQRHRPDLVEGYGYWFQRNITDAKEAGLL